MKRFVILLLVTPFIFGGCQLSTSSSGKLAEAQGRTIHSSVLYAHLDSAIVLNDNIYHVKLSQYDLTEIATAQGDTLQRPTFSCTIDITDEGGKVLYSDSVMRDSWGYPGRMVPIERYQINFPSLHYAGNEIILFFRIYELSDSDAIDGIITFNIATMESHFHWKEAFMEESFGVMPWSY